MGNGLHSSSPSHVKKEEKKYCNLLANIIACNSNQNDKKKRAASPTSTPPISPRGSPCLCRGHSINPPHKKLQMLVNQHDQWGLAPLHRACEIGNADVVHILLHFGALPNLTSSVNHGYVTPLLVAASGGHTECAQLLLKFGADVNQTDCWGNSALYKASCYNFSECVALFLESGATPNKVNKWGALPLQYAAIQGNHEVVSLLLEHGADVEMWGEEREPQAVTGAVIRGHHECLQLLLEAGAPVNLSGIFGNFSPLEALVYYGCDHLSCLKLLLNHGAVVTPLAISYLHQCNDCAYIANNRPAFLQTLLTGIGPVSRHRTNLIKVFTRLTQSIQLLSTKHMLVRLLNMGISLSRNELFDIFSNSKCQLSFSESAELVKIVSNPLSLASLSRKEIRANLNCPIQKNIDQLPLPKLVQDFLKHTC